VFGAEFGKEFENFIFFSSFVHTDSVTYQEEVSMRNICTSTLTPFRSIEYFLLNIATLRNEVHVVVQIN